jgi:hypothetical protein
MCDQARIRVEIDDVCVSLPVLLDAGRLPFGVLVRAPEKAVSGYNARPLVVLAFVGDLLKGNFAPAVLVLFFQLLEHLQSTICYLVNDFGAIAEDEVLECRVVSVFSRFRS